MLQVTHPLHTAGESGAVTEFSRCYWVMQPDNVTVTPTPYSSVPRAGTGLLAAVLELSGPSRVDMDDPQHALLSAAWIRVEGLDNEVVRHLQGGGEECPNLTRFSEARWPGS